MFFIMIGSRKTVPPRMLRIVPLGLFHICFSLNSDDATHAQNKAMRLKLDLDNDESNRTKARTFDTSFIRGDRRTLHTGID